MTILGSTAALSQGDGMDERTDPVAEAIQGAAADWTVSSDAMRWSPSGGSDPLGQRTRIAARVWRRAGLVLHRDPEDLRRLASRAITPFAEVAAHMLDELRGRTRQAQTRRRPTGIRRRTGW